MGRHPGTYIERIPRGAAPIEAASDDTTLTFVVWAGLDAATLADVCTPCGRRNAWQSR
jgi:hypothetical protein